MPVSNSEQEVLNHKARIREMKLEIVEEVIIRTLEENDAEMTQELLHKLSEAIVDGT